MTVPDLRILDFDLFTVDSRKEYEGDREALASFCFSLERITILAAWEYPIEKRMFITSQGKTTKMA
jgi:hypothetical protein